MAQYNFEGDFACLNERQLDFINKVIHEQDFKVNKIVFLPLGQAGDNFMGYVKRINIEGDRKSMKIILKIASSNEMTRITYNTGLMFRNEHIMYTEVLPKLTQLQKAAGVPPEEHLRYAKCYGSFNEEPHEIILLEDLNESGFSMMDKFKCLPEEHLKNSLKNIAILHSLSYALKNKEPETYIQYKEMLKDPWKALAKSQLTVGMGRIKMIETGLIDIIEDNAYKNLLKNKITDAFILRKEFEKYENDNNHTVIQHGDAWTNNIMFKVVDDSVQSVLIDYQAVNNNNPLSDILFIIYTCTDYESRSKNFYDWIDYYHSELDNSLSHFGLTAKFCYPREQIDGDLKRYAKIIFGICLLLLNLWLRDSEEAVKFQESMKNMKVQSDIIKSMKTQDLQRETVDRMNKKVVGLCKTLLEFDLI